MYSSNKKQTPAAATKYIVEMDDLKMIIEPAQNKTLHLDGAWAKKLIPSTSSKYIGS